MVSPSREVNTKTPPQIICSSTQTRQLHHAHLRMTHILQFQIEQMV